MTYPMLYCLVKGKKQKLYVRLLKLVEAIATRETNKPIFKRPVQIMMDFETAMINAVCECSTEAQILCCFFHFTSNVRKHSVKVMAAIKSSVGQNAENMSAAKKTKRALMMLPLLPEELITTDLVDALLARFDAAVPECAGRLARCETTSSRLTSDQTPGTPSVAGVSVGARFGRTMHPRAATPSSTRPFA